MARTKELDPFDTAHGNTSSTTILGQLTAKTVEFEKDGGDHEDNMMLADRVKRQPKRGNKENHLPVIYLFYVAQRTHVC